MFYQHLTGGFVFHYPFQELVVSFHLLIITIRTSYHDTEVGILYLAIDRGGNGELVGIGEEDQIAIFAIYLEAYSTCAIGVINLPIKIVICILYLGYTIPLSN